MINGYTGKILDIDLTDKTVKKTPLDLDDARMFLGARGIMTKLLWDRMKPGTTAFSPDNLIMFFTGPLTGVLNGNRTIVRFKSPLTATSTGLNLMGHTATGGNWGAELKYAGFDGIVVRGLSDAPVYLWVHDGEAELRAADDLWGKDIFVTQEALKARHGREAQVVCIGPGGELLFRFTGYPEFKVDGRHIHRTERGELVMSKSELVIADKLHARGIDYAYESPLVLPGGRVRFP
jgi:aldehyde:ferredoxin oxidoreductase